MEVHENTVKPWHSLVLEAEARLSAHLDENLESYLVFMLMRHLRDARLVRNTLALAFLEGIHKQGSERASAMQVVGDQCLLYAGFFPEQARRRHVGVDYFINIGRSAYGQLPDEPFTSLSAQFVLLMDVLAQIRAMDCSKQASLLDLQTLWEQSDSHFAAKTLQQNGVMPVRMVTRH